MGELRIQVHLRRFVIYGAYRNLENGELDVSSWAIGGGVIFKKI